MTTKEMFDIANSMNHVHRWNGRHIIGHRRSLSEHSYEVSIVSLQLCSHILDNNLKSEILHYALIHDVTERITGDVPYVAKLKYPNLKKALTEIENDDITTQFSEEAKFVVKIADIYVVFKEIEYEVGIKGESDEFNYSNVLDIIEVTFNKYIGVEASLLNLLENVRTEVIEASNAINRIKV